MVSYDYMSKRSYFSRVDDRLEEFLAGTILQLTLNKYR